jgi:DNA-binding transcriptional LysR family regulator
VRRAHSARLANGQLGKLRAEDQCHRRHEQGNAEHVLNFVPTQHGSFDPAVTRRTFRLAAPDYLNDFLMPTLIARFREAAPQARLDIDSLNSALDHSAALSSGEIDLVVGNWPKPDERFACSDSFSDTAVCLMRADHPLAHAPLTPEAYFAAAHLAPPDNERA